MNKQVITFSANEQSLIKTGGINNYASNIVSYVEAHFDLGANWQGYDSIRAIWHTQYTDVATVLDTEGICIVPAEVLNTKARLTVNLVGSISENDVLTDRLTTYPIEALIVDANARITAGASQPITPSEYEQFVATVKADADRAEDAKDSARVYAGNALSSAQNALASETNAHTSEVNARASELNAETYKNQAQTYAQNADISATNAENAKDEAIDARDEIRNMSATATTLPAGSNATASYADGVLSLGIPKGDKGDKGNTGETGAPAGFGTVSATVDASIGTPSVEVTASGADTAKNFAFAFHNLKGQKGDKGDTGDVSQAQLDAAVSDLKSELTVNHVPLKVLTGFTGVDTINGYVQTDGTFRDNVSGWVRTDYIETVSGAHIVSSLKGYDVFPIIAFYDESKTYMQSASVISSTQSIVNTDITVPSGVKYAIFVCQTNYDDRGFSIEVPSTIGETVSSLIDEVDEIKTELATDYYKNITGFDGQTTYNGYVKDDGTFNDGGTGWVRTGYIETGEGATLISSLKGYLTFPLVAFYDENKTYMPSISVLSDTQSIINTNMKVPAGVKYAVFVSQTNYADRVFTIGTPANITEALNIIGDDLYPYENLNIACLGDSLTKGLDGNNQVLLTNYPYYMQQTRLKKCNINNLGVSGSTTKTYWNNNKSDINVDQTTDVILCMWGTNGDLMSNTLATDVEPYDDYEDYANTGVGCYCKIIEYLMELTQNKAQIVLLTPPYNGNNSINDRVYAAQSVTKAIAERYMLPVVDMFQCGINPFNYSRYMPIDSVHFSAEGYEYIGKYIGSCIESVCAK